MSVGNGDLAWRHLKLSRPNRFSYDRPTSLFLVGDERISLAEMTERVEDPVSLARPGEVTTLSDKDVASVLNYPMVKTAFRLLMLPPLYNYLGEVRRNKETVSELCDGVVGVGVEVSGQIGILPLSKESCSLHFVGVDHPHLMAAAGLGVNMGVDQFPNSALGPDHFDKKVAVFDKWNVDSPYQEVVLMAMLGHVARLAELWSEQ